MHTLVRTHSLEYNSTAIDVYDEMKIYAHTTSYLSCSVCMIPRCMANQKIMPTGNENTKNKKKNYSFCTQNTTNQQQQEKQKQQQKDDNEKNVLNLKAERKT